MEVLKRNNHTIFSFLRKLLAAGLLLVPFADLQAQDQHSKQSISGSALIPLANFSSSHVVGAGLSYARYFKPGRRTDSLQRWSLVASGAIDYYIGRSTEVAGYPFKYGNDLQLNLMGGLRFSSRQPWRATIAAGPVLDVYKSSTAVLFGANFHLDYVLGSRFSLGPGLYFRKGSNADALWALAIRASHAF